ncbi:MAG: tRNA preQ1(34) S-adenosylmethionine ribosyltransferase-isomerase QueA [Caldisericia bacterium]|nr:tRNA preQ1(34) S-adenosylmethionine ribosyltransferase-isomerase QueA [Caldisericia bacterium]
MKTTDFTFDLPAELIAQTPSLQREMARMMVLDRKNHTIAHKTFIDVLDYFRPGDVLVINDTRVIPARLFLERKDTGGHVEVLLIRPQPDNTWICYVTPGRKARVGQILQHSSGKLEGKVLAVRSSGERIIEFTWNSTQSFIELLETVGKTPLPPYIKSDPDEWKEYYQTVYAKYNGSVAAPTAGLHFTEELLKTLTHRGIQIVTITLHVGPGTFKPVKCENIEDHKMDFEWYEVSEEAANAINIARQNGHACVGVGTTVTRTLESCAKKGMVHPGKGSTGLFIKPGYSYQVVDRLITNFHLPGSTLIMLVSAFYTREHVLKAYQEAVQNRYQFYSFGDAMFVL